MNQKIKQKSLRMLVREELEKAKPSEIEAIIKAGVIKMNIEMEKARESFCIDPEILRQTIGSF